MIISRKCYLFSPLFQFFLVAFPLSVVGVVCHVTECIQHLKMSFFCKIYIVVITFRDGSMHHRC